MHSPPSSRRALLIVSRAAIRGRINRFSSKWLKKMALGDKAGVQTRREATPRKRKRSLIAVALFGFIFLMNYVNLWSRFLPSVSDDLDMEAISARGNFPITVRGLREIDTLLSNPGTNSGETLSAESEKRLRDALSKDSRRIMGYLQRQRLPIDEMLSSIKEDGLGRFELIKLRIRHCLWPSVQSWPAEENEDRMILCLGFISLLLFAGAVLSDLGIRNMDLGKLDWDMQWLSSFPVSPQVLIGAKLIEYSLFNIFSWAFILPFFFVCFWSSGYGLMGVPIALVSAAYVAVLCASCRTIIETWLRKNLSRKAIRNFQAVFSVFGVIFLLLSFAGAMPGQASRLLAVVDYLPGIVPWLPTSLPVLLCAGGSLALPVIVLAVISVVLFAFVSIEASSKLIRDGLVREPGPYTGKRDRASDAKADLRSMGGFIGKDLRLLVSNRAILIQMTVLPAMVIALRLLMWPLLPREISGDFRHAAAMAFFMGLLITILSSTMIVAAEAESLWLLFTFPIRLKDAIVQKTKMWAILALSYGLVMLAIAFAILPSSWTTAVWSSAFALAGIATYSVMASGLAVLMTDPFERDLQWRASPALSMLLMTLGGMYMYGIYAPTAYQSVVVLCFGVLLCLAVWQHAMGHLPYILDPTQNPPHRIGVIDGVVVSYAFFALQGLLFLPFYWSSNRGVRSFMLIAYAVAAGVVALCSILIFRHLKVPDLWETIGLKPSVDSSVSWEKSLRTGLFWGLLAAVFGVLYLNLIEFIEPLKELKSETLDLLSRTCYSDLWWIALLLVVAAPLFEEYIFRGLLFKGMRRSLKPSVAILGSAAIFAMVHPPISALPVFALGLAAAISFERTGLLLAPVAAHATYNTVVLFAQFLSMA
ncbi:MAG: CPBP family intramembrane metalloprotease [Candidatus Coatesbacteria bacterium]|nr:CPBP family intramembrane metalloprotease [Candidatus Coatesbacteria bacterium]